MGDMGTHAPSIQHSIRSSNLPDSSMSQVLNNLVVPQIERHKRKRSTPSINSKAVCLTEDTVLEELKGNDKKRNEKKEKGWRSKDKKKGQSKEKVKERSKKSKEKVDYTRNHAPVQEPDIDSDSDIDCPLCGEHYGDRSATWTQCLICEKWINIECTGYDLE